MKHSSGNTIAVHGFAWLTLALLACLPLESIAAADDPTPAPVPIEPVPIAAGTSYADAIEAHMGYVTEHALDEYGPVHSAMWLATIDIRTSRLPMHSETETGEHTDHHLNCSNLYLDQPSLVAAHELARRTGCRCYSDAANAYLQAFRKASGASQFILSESRDYHLIRDQWLTHAADNQYRSIHTPAWETIWNVAPETTEQAIKTMAMDCLRSTATVNSQQEHRTHDLARQAVALDSLCWLMTRTNEPQDDLLSWARQIANHQPKPGRSSDEIGIWVESLIRASRYTGEQEFEKIAGQALSEALEQDVDLTSGKSALPIAEDAPFDSSEIKHDNLQKADEESGSHRAMTLAEACLSMWEVTQHEPYRRTVSGFAESIRVSFHANSGPYVRAEDYGRAIHFLVRASDALQQPEWRDLAREIAADAVDRLYEPKLGMFRSRLGVDRCDAIDGPGFLILALLYLEGPDPTEPSALHF